MEIHSAESARCRTARSLPAGHPIHLPRRTDWTRIGAAAITGLYGSTRRETALARAALAGYRTRRHAFGLPGVARWRLILVGESWSRMASLKSTPNFSVPGSFYGADVWLVRLDSAWNKSWDRSFGGAVADVASRIELLPDGGLLLAGYTDAAGGGNQTSPRYGREDFWLVRLETGGSNGWEFSLGSSKTDELFALYCIQDGGFLLMQIVD